MTSWTRFGTALFGLTLFVGCSKEGEESTATIPHENFKSAWTCEEHWMVSTVASDLQGMAKLAGASHTAPPCDFDEKEQCYTLGNVQLKPEPSCWDLASYKPLLQSWSLKAEPATDDGPDLIHDLLTPTAESLQNANNELSARIEKHPNDPSLHEDAAFLLGVFGIRENACAFGDLRPLICRMTAHLAFADRLRDGTKRSATGEWAKVLFDLHTGRPKLALATMEAIPDEGNAGRWKRCITLLITRDWRRADDLSDPSLAESIAHLRALKVHRGNQAMLEIVGANEDLQIVPEWSRLLVGSGKSVEEGHLAMSSAIALELVEMGSIFPIGDNPQPKKLAEFIGSDAPSALVSSEGATKVIQDSDWAAYFRRHFFTICSSINRFTLRQWASDDAAEEWENAMLPYCRALPSHELIEPLLSTGESDFQSDLKHTADFILKNPEKVPSGLWFDYRFPNLEVSARTRMPNQIQWFRQATPTGTAYNAKWRIRFAGIQGADWPEKISELHQIDPWNDELCYELAENTGNNIDSVKRAWGDIREYSIRPLKQILDSSKLSHDDRIETLKILIKLDPEYGLDLGEALVIAERPEEAAAAYEVAFADASDRVRVSNKSRWLISYYMHSNQPEKAHEVADHIAEVYSHSGLGSAMILAISEKDFARARELAKAISERYGSDKSLAIVGWAAGDKDALKDLFPNGLQEVTTADFASGEAVKGMRIVSQTTVMDAAGLRRSDVILAIDGKRIETLDQYFAIMDSQLGSETSLIIKRRKEIMEINCQLPDRRLGSDLIPVKQ